MNVVPDFGNFVNELPNKKPDESASQRKVGERSFSSYLDDQNSRSEDVQESNGVATAENKSSKTEPSDSSSDSDLDRRLDEENAITALPTDYFVIVQADLVGAGVSTAPEDGSELLAAVDVNAFQDASNGTPLIAGDQIATIQSDPIIASDGDVAVNLPANTPVPELADASTAFIGDQVPIETADTVDSETETDPESVLQDIGDAASDTGTDKIVNDASVTDLESNEATAIRSAESLASANVRTNSANQSTVDPEDDLPSEIEAPEVTISGDESASVELPFNDGDNGSEQSFETFEQPTSIESLPNQRSNFNNDSVLTPASLVSTVQEVSSGSSRIEAVGPTQDISAPTSQLKVAIVANAANIESESTNTIQVDLHPAELGRLQVRIEQTGDQLHAKIIATEIASSELLMQDRQHLVQALDELGFGETSLDITHQESGDPRDRDELFNEGNTNPQNPVNEDATHRNPATYTNTNSVGINFVA